MVLLQILLLNLALHSLTAGLGFEAAVQEECCLACEVCARLVQTARWVCRNGYLWSWATLGGGISSSGSACL